MLLGGPGQDVRARQETCGSRLRRRNHPSIRELFNLSAANGSRRAGRRAANGDVIFTGLARAVPRPVGRGESLGKRPIRSEEHTSELQSLMRTSYAVFCLKKKN